MSVDQVVFAVAGAVCIVGAVIAVTHRDPRASGVALTATLLALAVLYAGLAAPAVAAAVILVALFATLPFVVQLTVPTAGVHTIGGPSVPGIALLLGAALLAILAVAIALGEVPVNVSLRSGDGYDFAALGDLLAGRAAVAAGGSVLVLVAAFVAARAARRDRRSPQ
jgi:NADH:ubiquinone oxidoreductase subunit 6 (subunit J)